MSYFSNAFSCILESFKFILLFFGRGSHLDEVKDLQGK